MLCSTQWCFKTLGCALDGILFFFFFFLGVKVAQSCPTLCDPMDCSPPGFSVYGILQARILEWVAIPFSRGSSQHRDQSMSPTLHTDSSPSKPLAKFYFFFFYWGVVDLECWVSFRYTTK